MAEELLIIIIILGIPIVSGFIFRNDYSKLAISIFIASIIGALIAGMGIRIREVVEGPFAYLDSMLAVLTGMIFISALMDNGTIKSILNRILSRKNNPVIKALSLILFVALPGIMTGTATTCILTTGTLLGAYLLERGIEKTKVIEFISISSLIGLILPPICLPAMVIVLSRSGSYPASFEGYAIPLLVLSIPALIVYSINSAKWIKKLSIEDSDSRKKFKELIPLAVVVLLLICHNFFFKYVPFLGYPLIFVIGTILANILPNNKFNGIESAGKAISIVAPVVAIGFVVGSALEIFSLTGVSGWLSTIFHTVNPATFTLVSVILLVISGIIFGTPSTFVIAVTISYVIGSILYVGNEIILTAISSALCLGSLLSLRGGLFEKTQIALNIDAFEYKALVSKSIVPAALILLMGIIYSLAYESLLFLVI
jgi:TRAP-type C4-dicarboxylate transport system permease large subunit